MKKINAFRLRKTSGSCYREEFLLDRCRMPFLNSSILCLNGYGESLLQSGTLLPLFHPYWSIQLIQKGTLMIQSGDNNIPLGPGDLFIMRPGVHYHFTVPQGGTVKKKCLMINNGPLISLLCNKGPLSYQDTLSLSDPSAVEAIFAKIKKLASEGVPCLTQELSNLAYSLFTELIAQCSSSNAREHFENVAKSIVANPGNDYSLDSLAKQFNVGKWTLTRLFRRHLNCTPLQYVINMRMEYAAQLLSINTLTVKEIAEECGYQSLSFFSNEFKKHYGMAPRDFRNRNLVTEATCRRECIVIPAAPVEE